MCIRDRYSELKKAFLENGFNYRGKEHKHGLHSPYWWLKCFVGVKREDNTYVNFYKRFLEWDIMKKPLLTRILEKLFDPLMGKSIVLYFKKNN